MNLLDEDSDTDVKFSINENYAKRYDKWRQGEELQKLKDKYGDDVSEESSTSEDEDDDAKELTEDIEKDFFKTLSCLKERNPKIYDKDVRFFKSESAQVDKGGKKEKAEKAMSLGEYQRKVLLEKGGQFSDDEDGEKNFQEMTNIEQEKALKESFKDVLKDSDSESEKEESGAGNWGGLFKKRVKTQEELKKEEDDYKSWLVGEKKRLKNSEQEKELKGLHDYWSDPKLDEGEKFLRDYILNKRFLEKDDKKIPAYEEVVASDDSADENILEQQEEFERKYNFRFEEPDQEFIKRYPRTMEQSMRKKNDKRKRQREEVKARKEKEKAKKTEELKRLKSLKRKEILEKIKKLQEITGNEDMGFQKNDLEDDFDPEEHDKRMSELFNEDYYGVCNDEEKPEDFELDKELEIENWDEWGGEDNENGEELHCEDPGFNMDCDYDPKRDKKLENELIESTKKRKKRKQSKFSAAVAREKPLFNPQDKTFEKYIDEYYSLDYEDLIGDLPCRFKYRKVVPNDFGLSVEEILAAPDKELNKWASVKKIMQRRPDHIELYDVKAYRKKASDFNKKKKCLPSLYDTENENGETTAGSSNANTIERKEKNKFSKPIDSIKKKKGKGKTPLPEPSDRKKGKAFKSSNKFSEKKNDSKDAPYNISDNRLKSYGINPKKLKNKLKYSKKNQ